MDQQGRCPTISGSVSLDTQFLCHRFVAKEFRNGNFIIARRVVECDRKIDGDRLLAHQDDALEEFPLFGVGAGENGNCPYFSGGGKNRGGGVARPREEGPGVGKNQGLSPFFQRKMGICPNTVRHLNCLD